MWNNSSASAFRVVVVVVSDQRHRETTLYEWGVGMMSQDVMVPFEAIALNERAPAQFGGRKINSHEMACTFFETYLSAQQRSKPHWKNAIAALNNGCHSTGMAHAHDAFLEALICEGYANPRDHASMLASVE